MAIQDPVKRARWNRNTWILFCFSIIFAGCALFFEMSIGPGQSWDLPPEGGLVGPIQVNETSVHQINLTQNVANYGDFSEVEGVVLDQDQEYLFSFTDEMWKEEGYDDEGHWSEEKNQFDVKIRLDPGVYFLEFATDANRPQRTSPIAVSMEPLRGASFWFVWAGILFFASSMAMFLIANADE